MITAVIWVIVPTFLLVVLCLAISNDSLEKEKRAKNRLLAQEKEKNHQIFLKEVIGNWRYHERVTIDGALGLVSLDSHGARLRLTTYKSNGQDYELSTDKAFPITIVKGIEITQPMTTKTVTHIDKVPVVKGNKKSPVGRALLGGVVLGPVGAVVGGVSGLSGKGKVEYVKQERKETVGVLADAKVNLALDDLETPFIQLKFANLEKTNDWVNRLDAARSRFATMV